MRGCHQVGSDKANCPSGGGNPDARGVKEYAVHQAHLAAESEMHVQQAETNFECKATHQSNEMRRAESVLQGEYQTLRDAHSNLVAHESELNRSRELLRSEFSEARSQLNIPSLLQSLLPQVGTKSPAFKAAQKCIPIWRGFI